MQKLKLISLAFVSLFLIGCATMGTKIEQSELAKIKDGVTTENEIIALFGAPSSKTVTDNGNILMLYVYTKASPKLSSFVPVVSLISSGTNSHQETLSVLLDENGIVKKHTFNDVDDEIKIGILP